MSAVTGTLSTQLADALGSQISAAVEGSMGRLSENMADAIDEMLADFDVSQNILTDDLPISAGADIQRQFGIIGKPKGEIGMK